MFEQAHTGVYPWPKMTLLPCRVCDSDEEVERHHLVSRTHKLAISHVTVPLCRTCHDAMHGELGLNERIQTRRKLRTKLTGAEIDFIVKAMGPNYLRRKYPSRPVRVSRLVAA